MGKNNKKFVLWFDFALFVMSFVLFVVQKFNGGDYVFNGICTILTLLMFMLIVLIEEK